MPSGIAIATETSIGSPIDIAFRINWTHRPYFLLMVTGENWKAKLVDGTGSPLQSGAPSVELTAEEWDTYFQAIADTSAGALVRRQFEDLFPMEESFRSSELCSGYVRSQS